MVVGLGDEVLLPGTRGGLGTKMSRLSVRQMTVAGLKWRQVSMTRGFVSWVGVP